MCVPLLTRHCTPCVCHAGSGGASKQPVAAAAAAAAAGRGNSRASSSSSSSGSSGGKGSVTVMGADQSEATWRELDKKVRRQAAL